MDRVSLRVTRIAELVPDPHVECLVNLFHEPMRVTFLRRVQLPGTQVDRAAVRAMRMGLEIAILLQKMYPENFDASKSIALLGNAETVQKLKDGVPAADIVISWQPAVTEYDKTRRRYFLYK